MEGGDIQRPSYPMCVAVGKFRLRAAACRSAIALSPLGAMLLCNSRVMESLLGLGGRLSNDVASLISSLTNSIPRSVCSVYLVT